MLIDSRIKRFSRKEAPTKIKSMKKALHQKQLRFEKALFLVVQLPKTYKETICYLGVCSFTIPSLIFD